MCHDTWIPRRESRHGWFVAAFLSALTLFVIPTIPAEGADTLDSVNHGSLPAVMHFCAGNCMTLQLRGDHYEVTDPSSIGAGSSIWTVLQFAAGHPVIFHRRDAAAGPGVNGGRTLYEVTYQAEFAASGDSLLNVRTNGSPDPGIRWVWGAILNTVPGSNAERASLQRAAQQAALQQLQQQVAKPPAILQLCAGPCDEDMNGRCDSYAPSECQILVRDGDSYDAMDQWRARRRIRVNEWSDGHVKLEAVDDPIEFDRTQTFEGQIAPNGAIYGTATFFWQGHTFHGDVSPRGVHYAFKAAVLPKPTTVPTPCAESTPRNALTEQAFDDIAWRARYSSDLANSTCWDRMAAQQGLVSAYRDRAYDLLFGTAANPVDGKQAMSWALKAGDQGAPGGYLIAAELYRRGIGVAVSSQQAKQYEGRAHALEVKLLAPVVQTMPLEGKIQQCAADWGLMAEMGFDCYQILASSLSGVGPSEPLNCTYENLTQREQCDHASALARSQALDALGSARERAESICQSYKGDRLSNGEPFDIRRCNF